MGNPKLLPKLFTQKTPYNMLGVFYLLIIDYRILVFNRFIYEYHI